MSPSAEPTFWDRHRWLLPTITAVLGFLGSTAGAWLGHGWSDRARLREMKRERYRALLVASSGFLTRTPERDREKLQRQFIEQRDLCRLDCPDEVVRALNRFTDRANPKNTKVYQGQNLTDYYLGLQLELRKDLHPRTELSERDMGF